MIASATTLSLTALARIAERHLREHGPVEADELLDFLTIAANFDRDRARAGIHLALAGGRIMLDRDATLRSL